MIQSNVTYGTTVAQSRYFRFVSTVRTASSAVLDFSDAANALNAYYHACEYCGTDTEPIMRLYDQEICGCCGGWR